ncbi:MAG: cytochrome c biogenesis protein ResB [Micrococcales bacterium]|nr:cytochrome c biogenesis protein ResB [Micrococcales bacterium]
MAVDITTPKATAPDPPEPERVSGWELFRWVYRFFYSKTVGLIVIIAMAVLVFIGTVVPQLPAEVKADPQRYQQFIDLRRGGDGMGVFGALTPLLDGLGMFDIYRSLLFIIVSGLLAASILACTAHRLPLLWKNWRNPRLVVPARAYDAARYRASVPVDGGNVEVMSQVREELSKQRYRVMTDPDHPKAVYADRFAWGGMGAAVSHLSFVVIIAAVVVSMNGGLEERLTVPTTGEPVAVEGTKFAVAATSYDMEYTSPVSGKDYVSQLVVTKNGRQVAEGTARVNAPLRVGGSLFSSPVSFYQYAWLRGVNFTVKPSETAHEGLVAKAEPDGVLFSDFRRLWWNSPTSYEGHPDGYDLTYAVYGLDEAQAVSLLVAVVPPGSFDPVEVFTSGGELWKRETVSQSKVAPADSSGRGGQALLEVRQDGTSEPLASVVLDTGEEWVFGDYAFTFNGQQQYPVIQARQDPGEPLMWVGSVLLVLGLIVVFACRHRRLWVTWDAQTSRIRFASTDKSDTAWARRFRATVEAVAQRMDSAAQHGPPLDRKVGVGTKGAAGSTKDTAGRARGAAGTKDTDDSAVDTTVDAGDRVGEPADEKLDEPEETKEKSDD